jgi:TonB family protein
MLYSKLAASLFIMAFPLCAIFAQNTKIVTLTFSKTCPHLREQFSVLVATPTIRHGKYASYYPINAGICDLLKAGQVKSDDYIRLTGSYENGKKQGKWVELGQKMSTNPNKDTISAGMYKDDNKIGVWKLRRENLISETFDYDKNLVIDLGGHYSGIKYPRAAAEAGIQGTVIVKYQRLKDGSGTNFSIKQSLRAECDAAAIESVKSIAGQAEQYFKLYHLTGIEKEIEIPIKFSLD